MRRWRVRVRIPPGLRPETVKTVSPVHTLPVREQSVCLVATTRLAYLRAAGSGGIMEDANMRPMSGKQCRTTVRQLPECGYRSWSEQVNIRLSAIHVSPGWHLAIPVLFILVLSLVAPVYAAANAQVSVSASPSIIQAGETSTITVIVTHEYVLSSSIIRSPLPNATVSLSTTSSGVTFSPASGTTDSQGMFTSTLLASSVVSGSLTVYATAQLSNDFYGEGSATITVQQPALPEASRTVVTNQPPVAVITLDRYAGPAPLTIQFDGQKSHDPDGAVQSYAWDFGDGTTGTGYVAGHQYTTPGTFLAFLIVTDANGLSSNPVTTQIMVQSGQASELNAGEPCDDNNKCTAGDAYNSQGTCIPGQIISCDDSNPETADTCEPATGCVHAQKTPVLSEEASVQPTATPSSAASPTMNVQTIQIQNPDIFTGIMNSLFKFIRGLIGYGITPKDDNTVPIQSDKQPVLCTDIGGTVCPNGCKKLKTDPQNCGSCGNACQSPAYSEPVCNNGDCSFSCIQNYADCNAYAPDGCEVNLAANNNNCGTCGHYCPTDRVCQNNACQCTGGKSDCNGVCTDLSQNSKNCGSCGKTCRFDQFCENGVCRCHYGTKECAGKCINPLTDPSIECAGKCINPMKDSLNCGTCGNNCGTGFCSEGKCHWGCFPADTLVATYESFKPISMVQRGDVIPGYDLNMNYVINRTITETFLHKNQSVLRLEFENDTIVCTPIQPFFTGTWTPASDLKTGDKVLCRDNHWEVLIKDPAPAGERDVYNLHGSPPGLYYASYYVGKSQLLVHNAKR